VLTRLHSLRSWSKTHQGRKLIRYTMVSGSSTIVSFVALSAFYGLNIIRASSGHLAGNLVASIPAYQLNRRWTWASAARASSGESRAVLGAHLPRHRRVPTRRSLARHEVRAHHWSHLANTGLVVFTNLASFAIFWVLKLIVFNRIFAWTRSKRSTSTSHRRGDRT